MTHADLGGGWKMPWASGPNPAGLDDERGYTLRLTWRSVDTVSAVIASSAAPNPLAGAVLIGRTCIPLLLPAAGADITWPPTAAFHV